MEINVDKTKTLHVRTQDAISKTTSEEVNDVCAYTCPHLQCGHKFLNAKGMKIHASKYKWKNEFKVQKIMGIRGNITTRQYLIRWDDYSEDFDTWEPRSNIHPDLIKDFEIENGHYDFDWAHRCNICDLTCVSARGIKVHKARIHKAQHEESQNFKGTLADKAVTTQKMVEQQDQRPHILCEGKKIENVFRFSYLHG